MKGEKDGTFSRERVFTKEKKGSHERRVEKGKDCNGRWARMKRFRAGKTTRGKIKSWKAADRRKEELQRLSLRLNRKDLLPMVRIAYLIN